jgi:hypothetical protein
MKKPKGSGRWSQIAFQLRYRFMRRMLNKFGGDAIQVAKHIGIPLTHANSIILELGLYDAKKKRGRGRPKKEDFVAAPVKRAWFGVEVSP